MRDLEYYIIEIIDILNDVKNEENDCCEGSLTDEKFMRIISYLVKAYEIKKVFK